MAKVYNKHHGDAPANAVSIMRGTEWGNPFKIGEHGNRDQVCDKFEHALREHRDRDAIIQRVRDELKGKDLLCCCAPARCHGDLLLRIANSEGDPFAESHGLPTPSKIPPMPEVEAPTRIKPLNQKTLEALAEVVIVTNDNIEFLNGSLLTNTLSPLLRDAFTSKRDHLVRGKEYLESLLAKKTHT